MVVVPSAVTCLSDFTAATSSSDRKCLIASLARMCVQSVCVHVCRVQQEAIDCIVDHVSNHRNREDGRYVAWCDKLEYQVKHLLLKNTHSKKHLGKLRDLKLDDKTVLYAAKNLRKTIRPVHLQLLSAALEQTNAAASLVHDKVCCRSCRQCASLCLRH